MSVTDSSNVTRPSDPGDERRLGELIERAITITAREMKIYSQRTAGSQRATERARKVLPAGVPSSFQAYEPWPVVVKHAAGSRMIDVDDNEYVDYDMGFGALFAGHMNPVVRAVTGTWVTVRHAVRARRRGL